MPPRAPPLNPSGDSSSDEDILVTLPSSRLPIPPRPNAAPKEASRINRALAEYYWPRHFERGDVDPASFFDRVLDDYATYEPDVVGDWLENMSTLYKLYKVCLNYGVSYGTPAKAAQARSYQGRTLAREPRVQDIRNHHRRLRAARGIFVTSVLPETHEPRIPIVSQPTPPPRPVETPSTVVRRGGRIGSPVVEPRVPSVTSDSRRSPTPLSLQSMSPPPPSTSRSSSVTPRGIQAGIQVTPNITVEDTSTGTQNQTLPLPSTRHGPKRTRSKSKLKPEECAEKFDELRKDDEPVSERSAEAMQRLVDRAWEFHLKSLRLHVNQSSDNSAPSSIPQTAQKHFIDAIGLIWMPELRKYFQNAVMTLDEDNMQDGTIPRIEESKLSLKRAILEAAKKEPRIEKLNNFGTKWDILRFIFLVERLHAKEPLPNLEHIKKGLMRWREVRSEMAHQDHSDETNYSGYNDDELIEFILFARKYVPLVNALDPNSPEAASIQRKLRDLQNCLYKDVGSDTDIIHHEDARGPI